MIRASLIGTLPPIKGISPYCRGLFKALSKRIEVDFIGFKSIYPDFLYPGGSRKEYDADCADKNARNVLTYYNPATWMSAGLSLKGDIVHAQWWAYPLAPIFLMTLGLAKMRGKRVVITVHNVMPHKKNPLNDFLNSVVLCTADSFIVHGERNKEILSKKYGISSERITSIPAGIPEQTTYAKLSKSGARKRLNLDPSDKVLLFFGNIRDYKGLDVLLEAMGEIKSDLKGVKLLIAGQPWGDWGRYERTIRKADIGENVVKCLGFADDSDVGLYFSASDIVVLPYKHFESQSGVGTLALYFGKPLIVSDVGGLTDFVKREDAIVKPGDSRSLAKAVTKILGDKRLRKRLESDSSELAKTYAWDRVAEQTVRVYNKVLEK